MDGRGRAYDNIFIVRRIPLGDECGEVLNNLPDSQAGLPALREEAGKKYIFMNTRTESKPF